MFPPKFDVRFVALVWCSLAAVFLTGSSVFADPAVTFPQFDLRATTNSLQKIAATRHINALPGNPLISPSLSNSFGLPQLPSGWIATPPVEFAPAPLASNGAVGGPQANEVGPQVGNASPPYGPAQIRGAYGLTSLGLSNTMGSGTTVAIVDAYGDFNSSDVDVIQSDLQEFCQAYGLQYNAPGSASPTLIEAFPLGAGGTAPSGSNWDLETALDVEYVHTMAPGAKILLVVAPDSSNSLYSAVQYAAANAPIVSMSWAGPEFTGETAFDITYFSTPGVSYFASSGDSGSGTGYPSASPNITAVGGTSLTVDTNNNYVSETGWNGSGGGISFDEPGTEFQNSWVTSGNREVPDVSADADPNTGVSVIKDGFSFQVGGTSLACPLWAGLTAVLDANLSQPITEAALHFDLYQYGNPSNIATYFHDIVSGSNGGFSAGPGYDLVTGIGSPQAGTLLSAILNTPALGAPVFTSPTTATGNIGSSFTYEPTATNEPTSFSATGLPSGFSINPVTGLILGVLGTQGTFSISLTANNATGSGHLTLSLTVNGPLPTPSITSNSTITGEVGQSLSYQITATNSPTSYNAVILPPSVFVNTSTGLVSGIPQAPGTFQATLSATDASGTGTKPVTITIKPAIPVIVGASLTTVIAGQPFSYQISAEDQPTSFSVLGTPTGLSVSSTTGLITGRVNTPGIYNLTLEATNITGTNSYNFQLVVLSAAPASIVVANTTDSGTGSLRAAITAANAAPGSTITFANGLSGTITLASNLPTLTTDVTIQGPGSSTLAISGAGIYRIFRCGTGPSAGQFPSTGTGGTATISGLTLENGSDQGDNSGGGAVLVSTAANLNLSNCVVTANSSADFIGGAISNIGLATITNCTISQNKIVAQNEAGGAIANCGILNILNSAIQSNTAPTGTGGAIWNDSSNTGYGDMQPILTLTNDTFANNTCLWTGSSSGTSGGAIINFGFCNVSGSTFTGNVAEFGGAIEGTNTTNVNSSTFTGNGFQGDWSPFAQGTDGGAIQSQGSLVATNSTFANNVGQYGSAIEQYQYGAFLTVENCTITSNPLGNFPFQSGAVFQEAYEGETEATLEDNIIYGNYRNPSGTPIDEDFGTQGNFPNYTIIYSDLDGNFLGTGNINVPPMLSALGSYSGPTQTFALLPGSPAIGAGTDVGLEVDQRGVSRQQQGHTDMGAFESQGFTVAATSGSNQNAPLNSAFAGPLTATVTANAPVEPVAGGIVNYQVPGAGASAILSAPSATISSNSTASVTATANGTAGAYSVQANVGTKSTSFNLTNGVTLVPPSITNATISPATLPSGGGTITVSATVTDSNVGATLSSVTANVLTNGASPSQITLSNGGSGSTYTGTFAAPANTTTTAIIYTANVSASDSVSQSAGPVAATGSTVEAGITLVAPSITNATISPATLPVSGGTITVSATVTDSNPGATLSSVTANVSGGVGAAVASSGSQITLSNGGSGSTYTGTFSAAANTTTSAITYTANVSATDSDSQSAGPVAATGSSIEAGQPANFSITSASMSPATLAFAGGMITITANVVEPNQSATVTGVNVSLFKNGASYGGFKLTSAGGGVYSGSFGASQNLTGSSITYTATLSATDSVGKKASLPVSGSTVEASGSALSITSASMTPPTLTFQGGLITITASVSEPNSGAGVTGVNVSMFQNGAGYGGFKLTSQGGGVYSGTFPAPKNVTGASQTYTASVKATDSAGLSATLAVSGSTVVPSGSQLSITSASMSPPTLSFSGGAITITANVNEPNASASITGVNVSMFQNGASFGGFKLTAQGGGVYSGVFGASKNLSGTALIYTATLKVTDSAGLNASAAVSGSTTEPSGSPLTITSASMSPANLTVSGGLMTFTVSVNEPNAGVTVSAVNISLFQNGGSYGGFKLSSAGGGVYTGSFPAPKNTSGVPIVYTATVKATDSAGLSATSAVAGSSTVAGS